MAIGGIMRCADDPHGEVVAAGAEAREAVGAERAEQHGEHGADAGDDQAVPDGHGVAVLEQHGVVGELDALRATRPAARRRSPPAS